MKKIIIAIISVITIFMIGCNKESEYDFIDDLGNKVKITSVERVGALTGSFAEVCQLSGMNLVCVTSDSYDERNMVLDSSVINAGSLKHPTLELVVASNPDFVVLSSQIASHIEIGNSLKSMGITVAYFETEEFKGYLNMLDICTTLVNNKESFKKYGTDVQTKINETIDKSKNQQQYKVLLIRAFSTKALAKDSNNLVGAMLKDLGCINIADNDESLLENLSMEVIIKEDPDFIFVTTMGDNDKALEQMANTLQAHPAWKDLSAIKNNHYHILEKKLFHYKPNALWSQSYEELYKILYQ